MVHPGGVVACIHDRRLIDGRSEQPAPQVRSRCAHWATSMATASQSWSAEITGCSRWVASFGVRA